MKKSHLLFLGLFFALLPVHSSSIEAQSVQEILESMIQAQGGRGYLSNIQDTTLVSYIEMAGMGLGGSLTTYQKEPNRLRTDAKIRGSQVIQAYDGEMAWMSNPITGGPEEMPEPMAKDFIRSALGNDAFLNPEKHGIEYILEGKQTVDGYEYYLLDQNFADGFQAVLYVDPATFLISKTVSTAVDELGNESRMETVFSNYKKVGAVTMAHSIITFQDGKEFMKMEITEVKFNSGLEDSFFQMKREIRPF